MRAVDLFCGAGGASLGLERAGYTVTGFDYWSRAVDTHNLNGLLAYEHNLALSSCDPGIPECDLLWASPPCQPFSAAGDGEGEADERDGFPWALRIIGRLLPSVVIFENVKGITFDKHAEYFGSVLLALTGLGYEWDWRVLNAADYGVPQTRQRCFIVARRDGGRIVWPLPTHTEDAGLFTEPWVTMAAALGWGMTAKPFGTVAGANNTGGPDMWGVGGSGAQAALVAERDSGRWVALTVCPDHAEHVCDCPQCCDEPSDNTEPGTHWILNTGCNWQKGQDRDAAQKINATTQPAPTVSCISGNQWHVFQPGGHHEPGEQSQNAIRLTIAELALLQGFPADYQWTGTKTDQARQVGNAVPPVMAQVLAEANRPVTA
jgi:DNA (cytosine-5)-methyltransferase 1